MRFLPTTVVIIIMGPVAGRLADRIGSRPLMTIGLLIVASALFIQSRLTVHTGYGLLLPGFVVMGMGMGLVMSPMSTAAMNAVDRSKAGAASGVLSMSRMVGGTFGRSRSWESLVTTIGRSDLTSSLAEPLAASSATGSPRTHSASGAGIRHAPHQVIAAVNHAVRLGARHRPDGDRQRRRRRRWAFRRGIQPDLRRTVPKPGQELAA